MIGGLLLLGGATALLCASTSLAMLIAGRILQGASGALVWTIGLALIVDTVDEKNLGNAMGWVGMSMSLAILAAPMAGGVIYDKGGYYPVFATCFGLIAVDVALRLAIIEVKVAKKWLDPRPDPENLSAQVQTDDVGAVEVNQLDSEKVIAVNPPPEHTVRPAGVTEGTGRRKLEVPRYFRLLRNKRLLAALWGTMVHSTLVTSFDSTVPLFVLDTFGWSSLGAGLAFLPIIVPNFASPFIGALSDRYGPKWFAAGGFLLVTPFLICLRFVSENTMAHKVMFFGLLAGAGVGGALIFAPVMAEISWAVEAEEALLPPERQSEKGGAYAQAYALFNIAFSGGALAGPLLGGLIRDNAGWGTMVLVLGLSTALTAVTQAIWIGGPLRWGRQNHRPSPE
jgi:MFS family permease